MTTQLLDLGDQCAPMPVVTLPDVVTREFVTPNGDYFVSAEHMLDSVHLVLHEVLVPMVEAIGEDRDPEVYANAGHALINLASESIESIVLAVKWALPAQGGSGEPSVDPQDA